MTLNAGQQKAKEIVEKGGNVFISGPGGYGKSFLTEHLATKRSIMCAPTGAAAILVGGSTCHRIFNAPVGVIKPNDAKKMKPETRKLLQGIDQVRLDEVSMLRTDMLQHINDKLQIAKENDKPFGGVPVIATGDFYQLPAFVGANERQFYKSIYNDKVMAFQADCWDFETVELTEPMRNVNLDQLQVLQSIRTGVNVSWAIQMLKNYAQPYNPTAEVTHLCAYNKDADDRNTLKYNQLTSEERVYIGELKGDAKAIEKECRVPAKMKCKVGMRVMTVTNDENDEYVNGTVGTITRMEEGFVVIEKDNGDVIYVTPFKFEVIKYKSTAKGMTRTVVASLEQLPIVPAWAISIHKSQGCTLDKAIINLGSGAFATGLLYVAISRVKDLTQISFTRQPMVSDVKVDPKVVEFYKRVL